jgi:hypothetical protein
MKFIFLFSISFFWMNIVNAQNSTNVFEGYQLKIRQIGEGPVSPDEIAKLDRSVREQCTSSKKEDRFEIQELITLGKEIWQIIKDGAPVINFANESASVIPLAAGCPFALSYWSLPQSKTYELTYENKFGMEMIYFTYKVIYSYGGRYQNKGAYLANVSIHPQDIQVAWGQSFDANVKIANSLNLGSQEDPIAGLEVSLEWSITNPITEIQSKRVYFVDGLGRLTSL